VEERLVSPMTAAVAAAAAIAEAALVAAATPLSWMSSLLTPPPLSLTPPPLPLPSSSPPPPAPLSLPPPPDGSAERGPSRPLLSTLRLRRASAIRLLPALCALRVPARLVRAVARACALHSASLR